MVLVPSVVLTPLITFCLVVSLASAFPMIVVCVPTREMMVVCVPRRENPVQLRRWTTGARSELVLSLNRLAMKGLDVWQFPVLITHSLEQICFQGTQI